MGLLWSDKDIGLILYTSLSFFIRAFHPPPRIGIGCRWTLLARPCQSMLYNTIFIIWYGQDIYQYRYLYKEATTCSMLYNTIYIIWYGQDHFLMFTNQENSSWNIYIRVYNV